jgi:hypothetical protein
VFSVKKGIQFKIKSSVIYTISVDMMVDSKGEEVLVVLGNSQNLFITSST